MNQRITVEQAKQHLGASDVFWLDVRKQEEFDAGHIEGSICIPHTEILDNLDKIPKEGKKLLVYCRSGKRSLVAMDILEQCGYNNILEMMGGYLAWAASLEQEAEQSQ